MHAGEEGVAPGSAALLGVIVHEDRTFVSDAIDVGRLTDHQAAVIDARLHDADVVAHDEQDVGLLFLLRGRRQARRRYRGDRGQQTEPDVFGYPHAWLPRSAARDGPAAYARLLLSMPHARWHRNRTVGVMKLGIIGRGYRKRRRGD